MRFHGNYLPVYWGDRGPRCVSTRMRTESSGCGSRHLALLRRCPKKWEVVTGGTEPGPAHQPASANHKPSMTTKLVSVRQTRPPIIISLYIKKIKLMHFQVYMFFLTRSLQVEQVKNILTCRIVNLKHVLRCSGVLFSIFLLLVSLG